MATVASGTRSTTYTLATASAGPFQVGHRLFDDDALNVYVNGLRSTEWTLTSDYEDGYDDVAYVTFDSALEAGDVVRIETSLTPARNDDYIAGDPTLIEKMNIELGRLWSAISDTRREALRSLRSFDAVDPVDGLDTTAIANAETYASNAATSASEAEAAATLAVGAQENLFDAWSGAWFTATDYEEGDLVREDGTTYICASDHTSDTFSTDYAGGKWEVFAQQGASGAGTGDMLAANNLSDLGDTQTAIANLGLGRVNGSTYNLVSGASIDSTVLPSGFYTVTSAVVGTKPGTLIAFELFVMRESGSTRITQLAQGSNQLWAREYVSGTWKAWERLVGWSQVESTLTNSSTKVPRSDAVYAALAALGWQSLTSMTMTGFPAVSQLSTIPAGTDEIEFYFNNVANAGSSPVLVQLGAGGVIQATGYTAAFSTVGSGNVSSTAGFPIFRNTVGNTLNGVLTLGRMASNEWAIKSCTVAQAVGVTNSSGRVVLTGPLDSVQVTTTLGTDNFTGGAVGLRYRP